MRTTVTLDSDAEQLLRQRMSEAGVSFKRALNDAVRAGLGRRAAGAPFRTQVASLGVSAVNLDRALQIVGDLEDDDLVRKMRAGS